MKRKIWLGLFALILVLAIGTTAFALENNGTFEQMQTYMKQVHPDLTDEQIQDMYQNCHSDGTLSPNMNQNGMSNMMGSFTS